MKSAIKQLSYVLFPRRCELCGEVVRPDEKYCRDCRHAERINGEICLKCAHSKTDCACSKKDKKPAFNGVVAPFYFRDSAFQGQFIVSSFTAIQSLPIIWRAK